MNKFIKTFSEIRKSDVQEVGGKNSSLGEMFSQLSSKGIRVPDGFATTAAAYWYFLDSNHLRESLQQTLQQLDKQQFSNLSAIGAKARELMTQASVPDDLASAIKQAYKNLCSFYDCEVAVRSSATAEDLPQASFAGQHESFLNISGEDEVVKAVQLCMVSLFTDRAIKYREDNGFAHMSIALSVGIQKMVRADKACAGVGFTLDPESGFRKVVHLAGIWGLGENIVQGEVTPDEFFVFKPVLSQGKYAIIRKKLGDKQKMMIYASRHDTGNSTINLVTPVEKREQFVLTDEEVHLLAKWAVKIEEHYQMPMDIEWAKDGISNELFILQARPETVHSKKNPYLVNEYHLLEKGPVIIEGQSVGGKITSGIARILSSPEEEEQLNSGEIIVTDITSPDWDPVLKKASGIITNKGGRTSHASIVARELGVPAVVGTDNATEKIQNGETITISCCEGETGYIYKGQLKWEEKTVDFSSIKKPGLTKPMLIVGDPDTAFRLSFYPQEGVGLMRLEFIIMHFVQIHPMALIRFDKIKDEKTKQEIEKLTHHYPDKEQYFVDKLSQGIATIAAAFYPKDVIVRMSDFKTNEYANLLGGRDFEPEEENPMLGFRGASRYYNDRYKEGFKLECEAIKKVRNEMGLTNVKVMIPFCRTVEEGQNVIAVMKQYGLEQGINNLEIYVMIEIPSNVLLAQQFAQIFDGFSIGSNDLTQLTLGIDRDSALVADLFNEQNEAVKKLIAAAIQTARNNGTKVGLCGQAPSDYPAFTRFLVEEGISSIAFNPDALLQGIENINKAEAKLTSVA